ncbi:hypothetical protein AGMMS50276_27290 [Synergistales bacterium]|nr:hypothetical protein AGMMS50276_27290 [Synergistales bacterium]
MDDEMKKFLTDNFRVGQQICLTCNDGSQIKGKVSEFRESMFIVEASGVMKSLRYSFIAACDVIVASAEPLSQLSTTSKQEQPSVMTSPQPSVTPSQTPKQGQLTDFDRSRDKLCGVIRSGNANYGFILADVADDSLSKSLASPFVSWKWSLVSFEEFSVQGSLSAKNIRALPSASAPKPKDEARSSTFSEPKWYKSDLPYDLKQAWNEYKKSALSGSQFEQRLHTLLNEFQNNKMFEEALDLLNDVKVKSNLPEEKIDNDRISILDRSRQNDALLKDLLLKRAKKSNVNGNISSYMADMTKVGRLHYDNAEYGDAVRQYKKCLESMNAYGKIMGGERRRALENSINRALATCYSATGFKDDAVQTASVPDVNEAKKSPSVVSKNDKSTPATIPEGITTLEELLNGISIDKQIGQSQKSEKPTIIRPALESKPTPPEIEAETTLKLYETWDAENPPLKNAASKEKATAMLDKNIECNHDSVRELVDILLEEASKTPITGAFLPAALARAVVLTKAFALKNTTASEHDSYVKLYTQLLLATDAPLETRDYSDIALGAAFDGDDLCTSLYIAALLRALFMPSSENYGVTVKPNDSIMDYIRGFSKSLGLVFDVLVGMRDFTPGCFSVQLLMRMCDDTDMRNREQQLADDAEILKHVPAYANYPNSTPFFATCFGNDSSLGRSMSIIAARDTGQFDFVKDAYENISDDVDKFIKVEWNEAINAKRAKSKQAEGRLLGQVRNHIQKRLDVMKAWLDLNSNAAIAPDDIAARHMNAAKEKILTLIPSALRETEEEHKNAGTPVIYMLKRVLKTLEKGMLPPDEYAFTDMLRTCFIELDFDGAPQLGRFDQVPGFESWQNALKHIASPQLSLSEVLRRIADANEKNYYDNIGSAILIDRLGTPTGTTKWEKFRSDAEKVAESDQNRFRADMTVAYRYGRIAEASEERILLMEEKFYLELWKNSNFAHYRLFLGVLREHLENETICIGEKFRESFESLRYGMGTIKNDATDPHSLLTAILKKLENREYRVAEDYIGRWTAGERFLTIDEIITENDAFGDFLDAYDKLREQCLKYKDKSSHIADWGYKIALDAIDAANKIPGAAGENVGKRNLDNIKDLLNGWPAKKDKVTERTLITLFKHLALEARNAERLNYDISNGVVFQLKIEKTPKDLPDYSHPIARFGTETPSAFYVVCLFGTVHPSQIVDNIRKLNLGSDTIVLLNSASMTRKNRQELADLSRKETQLNAFLFVDQTLLLYLATLDMSVRLSTLLKCTLPYTFYQPFSEGSGHIADEMFFGRRDELKRILDPRGASLVYGGRQLGKSALMARAESRANNPDKKEYAVLVTVNKANSAETLQAIVSKMTETKLINKAYRTWKGLFSALRALFDKETGTVERLLLLVDEADVFLEGDRSDGYRILGELNKLKNDTANRFKFVFAGLHHVARTSAAIDNNGIGPQIGDALCIKPMSPNDARNLLMRPLLYLGFHMDSDKIDSILAHTNYYPGTLQLVGNTLVRRISEDYALYYSADRGNPPCDIQDEALSDILASEDVVRRIKNMLDITLKADENGGYEAIAHILALLYYETEENEYIADGYSLKDIIKAASEWNITRKVTNETNEYSMERDFENLLDEMVEMGVLWKSVKSSNAPVVYRLRRNNFLGNIGDTDSVLDWLGSAAQDAR